MFGLSALTLVLVNFQEFRTKLPDVRAVLRGRQLDLAWASRWALSKILHEFGHGLSCKRYGGECHEMGFMFLVFTPCLYCNVSDSWMLPNKWHRVFIGAAGMYVELILASIATYLWWFSEPGMFNFLCLSVMFICSVSTVVFNGNPLLRFDGYYILMDILEIPNLRQKATEILKRWFQQYCLGLELQENPFLAAETSGLVRVLHDRFGHLPLGRRILHHDVLDEGARALRLTSLGPTGGLCGSGGHGCSTRLVIIKFFRTPGKASKMKRKNVLTSLAVAAAIDRRALSTCRCPITSTAPLRSSRADRQAGLCHGSRPIGILEKEARRHRPGRTRPLPNWTALTCGFDWRSRGRI